MEENAEVKMLKHQIKKLQMDNAILNNRLFSGRDYLMTTEDITVDGCLTAFGWDRNGFCVGGE